MDTASQKTVMLEAVWHHVDSLIEEGAGGDMTAVDSAATSRAFWAKELTVGEELRSGELVGAGEAVEVREDFLVGEGSKVGKLPRGVWRVDTIMYLKRKEM
jgi:hypothetical protein